MAASDRMPRRHDFFFSPRDYLNDPAVLSMSLLARGAYSTLLFALWDLPEPGVAPASPRALMSLARATPEEWGQVEGEVKGAFDTLSREGCWVQRRMVREHARQVKYFEDAKKLGRAGGRKSAELRTVATHPQGPLKGPSKAPPKGASTASLASLASQAEKKTPPTPPATLPGWLEPAVWNDWDAFRRSIASKAPWTPKARQLSIARLDELRAAGHQPRAVVDQSILNGWRGLFEVKPGSTASHQPNSERADRLARIRKNLEENPS
ncbi:MAG: hypothetical protein ACT4PE_05460 [Candidatus Eiseniibacteriota bacterium]